MHIAGHLEGAQSMMTVQVIVTELLGTSSVTQQKECYTDSKKSQVLVPALT